MRSFLQLAIIAASLVLLQGCLAKTAWNVATAPVKVASKGVDLATTSQSEADEKRGREMREADEKRAREARKLEERCRKGKALPDDNCPAG